MFRRALEFIMLEYFTAIWNILRPYFICNLWLHTYLVYFRFDFLYQEKSVNRGSEARFLKFVENFFHSVESVSSRVTRLGEFSPLGQVFTLSIFSCKITEVHKIVGLNFTTVFMY
jgi:hypothetical protein